MKLADWIRPRRAVPTALLILASGAAALLLVHYACLDVVARYPRDGTLNSCSSDGYIWKTTQLELTEDGTGQVLRVSLPPGGREVGDFARTTGRGSRVRVYYERRAIWLPWEGSTRRATGVDWLPPKGAPTVIGEHRPDRTESLAHGTTR